jgi:hypothetical protein
MTIAIGIAVPDGIALAADTQTTWHQTITKAKDKASGKEFELEEPIVQPVGWSRMAQKLFKITFANTDFAVCTAGAASLNRKTMYAIFKSLEHSYSGTADFKGIGEHLVNGLKEELKKHHGVDDVSKAPNLQCYFILAGFEDSDVSKPHLESHIVFSGRLVINKKENTSGHILSWQTNPSNRYGGCWIGRSEFISHIINHKNAELPKISGQYHLMTLADAVDYTRFLVEFTCDFQRFAVMVPDCGRPIISATLTPEEYTSEVLR